MKTIAIVQARLGSTRLPGKVLFEIAGRTMIGLMLERLKRSRSLDEIVLATGEGTENDALSGVVSLLECSVFRGPEEDVLARYAMAAEAHGADIIVRLTGDCPLMDPDIVDQLVRLRSEELLDFCTNVLPPTWPDGLDVAVFTRKVLDAAFREAKRSSDREHVVPWMWRQSSLQGGTRLKAKNVKAPHDLSHHRWTIDEAPDYMFLRALAAELGSQGLVKVGFKDILRILQRKPELLNINRDIVRDAGYAESLAEGEKASL